MEPEIINIYNKKINEYLFKHNEKCSYDSVIRFVLKQTEIEKVIAIAVKSRDEFGKMHSHQRRVPKIAFENFTEALMLVKKSIIEATEFDQLFSMIAIEGNKIFGVGEILIYDTSFRIGNWKNIFPRKIFLYAGTRKGVERFMNRKIRNNYFLKEKLKPPFNTCKLECWQLEDFFCIYKDIFNNYCKFIKKPKFC
jgi:hypothetical protein